MSLWDELGLDMARHRLVALVGAGGKTTTLYALAWEAAQTGRRVAVTTTTHILPHPRLPVAADAQGLSGLLRGGAPAALLGREEPSGKLSGALAPEALGALLSGGAADLVLVEADGAHRRPLKAPGAHEPVLPPDAHAVVALAGLSALGGAVGQVCHRPERAEELLHVSPGHRLGPRDVAALLSSPQGGRKGVPAGAAFRCLLCQGDTLSRPAAGEEVRALLAAQGVFCALHTYPEEERGGLCWF